MEKPWRATVKKRRKRPLIFSESVNSVLHLEPAWILSISRGNAHQENNPKVIDLQK
jgi:hypothetical protein